MSVFTAVTEPVLAAWLKNYAVGHLRGLQGISDGVQNSNFFVTTTLGRYVLTLFETIPRAELPYYLHLMAHLARYGLPVPTPIANRNNEYLDLLEGHSAVLVKRLPGRSEMQPTVHHCESVGAMLAGLHLAGLSYRRRQHNPRSLAWCINTAPAVQAFLPAEEQGLLADELAFQARCDLTALPAGAIHADLFRDNVLWDGSEIGGVIDFYFAGHDLLLLDVAITVNDWCSLPDWTLDTERTTALLTAYHAERSFTEDERQAWPALLRRAALRFWLSRAYDFYLPRSGEMVLTKPPAEYRDILRQRIRGCPGLP